jgi:hypothetical protein
VGLAEADKNCILFSGIDNYGDGTVSCAKDFQVPNGYAFRSHVKFRSLDSLVSHVPKIGAVKIDVEGFEGAVVAGGHGVLKNVPLIIMEFQPNWIRGSGFDPKDILDFFVSEGFEIRFGPLEGEVYSVNDTLEKAVTGLYDLYLTKKNKGILQMA